MPKALGKPDSGKPVQFQFEFMTVDRLVEAGHAEMRALNNVLSRTEQEQALNPVASIPNGFKIGRAAKGGAKLRPAGEDDITLVRRIRFQLKSRDANAQNEAKEHLTQSILARVFPDLSYEDATARIETMKSTVDINLATYNIDNLFQTSPEEFQPTITDMVNAVAFASSFHIVRVFSKKEKADEEVMNFYINYTNSLRKFVENINDIPVARTVTPAVEKAPAQSRPSNKPRSQKEPTATRTTQNSSKKSAKIYAWFDGKAAAYKD